jgi:hypothetical protein
VSAAYEYRKVYADLVTPEGEVLVVYLNYVKVGGVWTARASVELYQPTGERTLHHGVDHPTLVDIDTPATELPLTVQLADGHFTLELDPVLGPWRPPTPTPAEGLTWGIKAVRTNARAQWGDRSWEGTGYVDYVQITRPTRLLGLSHLTWGRVHLPDRTVVIEHIDTDSGARWDTGVEWVLGEDAPRVLDRPARLTPEGHGEVDLHDRELTLTPQRVLHDGNAFDAERVPRRIDRWFCEIIGGPTHETRWIGTARLGGDERLALYESVRFGAAATSTRNKSS